MKKEGEAVREEGHRQKYKEEKKGFTIEHTCIKEYDIFLSPLSLCLSPFFSRLSPRSLSALSPLSLRSLSPPACEHPPPSPYVHTDPHSSCRGRW